MKYAKAISPDRMNAAGRVSNPSSSNPPATISMMAAAPNNDCIGTGPVGKPTGSPNNFCVPWATKRKPATIRRTLKTGVLHLDTKVPIIWYLLLKEEFNIGTNTLAGPLLALHGLPASRADIISSS